MNNGKETELLCSNGRCEGQNLLVVSNPRLVNGTRPAVMICPRCGWPVVEIGSIMVFEPRDLPAQLRGEYHRVVKLLGLDAPGEIIKRGRRPRVTRVWNGPVAPSRRKRDAA